MPLNNPATPRAADGKGNARPGWLAPATARKRPAHAEDDLQALCIRWYRLQYPPLAALLFAIPNGGNRNAREGARLKRQGVTAGVPDLLLAKPRYNTDGFVVAAGLWLELKVGKNKPTPAQAAMQAMLAEHGYRVAVVYDFDTFRATVAAYLSH